MPATGQPTQTYSYDAAGNRTSTGTLQALVQENATSGLTYSGTWTQRSNASASGGAYKDTPTVGAYVDFSFSGTAVDYLYKVGGGGTARVILDPGPNQQVLADIDQCPGNAWQVKRSFSGFANTAHVLRVQYLVDSCGEATIWVDAFQAASAGSTYSYDDDNRLLSLSTATLSTALQYDKNGSALQKTAGSDVTTYAYL